MLEFCLRSVCAHAACVCVCVLTQRETGALRVRDVELKVFKVIKAVRKRRLKSRRRGRVREGGKGNNRGGKQQGVKEGKQKTEAEIIE